MADSFDRQLAAANVYAVSLFELAREAGQVEQVRAELTELVQALEAADDPVVRAFFESAALNDDVRAELLEKWFRGKLSDLTLNTLLVMNANGRTGLMRALLRDFVLAQEAAVGQIEATAVTAVPLDEAQRQQVTDAAAALSGRTPLIAFKVDPEMLGGLVLQIGDLRYDNSIRRKLREARGRLLERSERGLQVGVSP